MSLTYRFSVCPHGVQRFPGSPSEIYAVFKVISSVKEFESTNTQFSVTQEEWKAFVKTVNNLVFRYNFDKASNILNISIQDSAIPAGQNLKLINFMAADDKTARIAGPADNPQASPFSSFRLGQSNPYGDPQQNRYNMEYVETAKEGFFVPIPKPKNKITQHLNDFRHNGRDPGHHRDMTKNFRNAHKNKKQLRPKPDDGTSYDLKTIYGSILNEPYLAEHHYGLIRQIIIPVDEFLTGSTTQVYYSIQITQDQNTDSVEPANTFPYLLKFRQMANNSKKYYHGLKKIFFTDDDFDPQCKPAFSLCDLYKTVDTTTADSAKHPEALFLNVAYKTAADNTILDPFQSPNVKGYNILAKTDSFYSLSSLKKTYNPVGQPSFSYYTSGVLYARVETYTDSESEVKRNNVLFGWRGDNLLVNRTSHQTSQDGNGMYDRTDITFERDNYDNKYMHKKLHQQVEELVDGSQIPLESSTTYYFVLRSVNSSEYCIPSVKEISAQTAEYTWTAEDELENSLATTAITKSTVRMADLPSFSIPLKSAALRYEKNVTDPNPGNVDTVSHLVLNRIDGTDHERRFVYPPAIKLQDFKYLGFLDQDKLLPPGDNSERRFVHRCIHLEGLSQNQIRPFASFREKVRYLADPRGKRIFLLPADLYTINKQRPYGSGEIYEITGMYPYFDKTRSAEIEVSHNPKSAKDRPQYDLSLNGTGVYQSTDLGLYRYSLYITDIPNPQNDQQYSAQSLSVSLVGRPPEPKYANPGLPVVRTQGYQNYWYSSIVVDDTESWKSIKYTEETIVLNLNSPDRDDRLRRYDADNKFDTRVRYLSHEYPYEALLTTKGNIRKDGNYKTSLYPDMLTLSMKVNPQGLTDPNILVRGDLFFTIKLSNKDILEAKINPAVRKNLQLILNGTSIFDAQLNTDPEISLGIQFDNALNNFKLVYNGDQASAVPIPNLINPDLTIYDITINDKFIWDLNNTPSSIYIRLQRNGNYIFIDNLNNPYSCTKKVRLFASSPFQGYFPTKTLESELGTIGSTHDVFIPNNIQPDAPVIDANILFMYVNDEYWHDRETKNKKSSSFRHLIQITLSKDFMKEGQNYLGLILSRPDNAADDNISTVGEDITQLTDTKALNLQDLITFEDDKLDVFSKYLYKTPFETVLVQGVTYHVLKLVPFYNASLEKWQVILPLRSFSNTETLFFKLCAIKIAPGIKVEPGDKADPLTTYSAVAKPVILPVKNARTFHVQRDQQQYSITYEGPNKYQRKLFYLMFKKHDDGLTVIKDGGDLTGYEDIEPLGAVASADPKTPRKVLCFTGQSIAVKRIHCKKIMLMEFEALDNFPLGNLGQTPTFVSYNPLFNQTGIKLVSIAEFDASWLC